jgi:SAM-dependent methyltransferase
MNENHLQLCASPEWAAYVEEELLPWTLGGAELGAEVLEVGAGPGLTTDVLRLRDSNMEVVHADGTALPFASGRFSTATCFTMLHHVPTMALQDQLLAEVRRVLRPGGLLVGTDSSASSSLGELHVGDTYVPVDPLTLAAPLEGAGFNDVEVETDEGRFRFLGRAGAT